MDPRRHLDGGQRLRVGRRGGDVGHQRRLAGQRAEALAQHLSQKINGK